MKELTKQKLLQILFFVTIAVACIASVFAAFHLQNGPYTGDGYEIRNLDTGWQYETDHGRQEIPSLPAPVPGSPQGLTLVRQLPDTLPESPVLEFYSRQATVEVFLDGQCLYSYGLSCDTPVGNLLGNAHHVVPIPHDAQGKEISIRFTSPYVRDTYRIPAISLGCRAVVMYHFASSSIHLIVFCTFMAFFCLVTLLAAAILKLKRVSFPGAALANFTLFIFISVTWVTTDSSILQLLTPNVPVIYFVSHLTFMLIPLPLMIFLRQATRYKSRCYGALLLAFIAAFFLRLALFFGGIADLETSLFLTHILMAVAAVICIILLAKEWRLYREKTVLLFLVGFASLGGCLVVSLVLFMFANDLDYSLFFRIMLMLMAGAMFYEIFSQLERLAKHGIEKELYQKLAYTDSLTGMLNRTAFEERMAALEAAPDCRLLTMVVMDIDCLKHANDTYGHSVGDELIKHAAQNIQSHFDPLGLCFRVGGDEFAVILKDLPPQKLEQTLADFYTAVSETKLTTHERLHIAAGHATGPTTLPHFAYHLYDQADKAMYKRKAEQK